MRKRTLTAAAVLAAVVWLAGCAAKGGQKDLEERRAIIDDYAEILLMQDQDSARYDQALSAVENYLEEQTPNQKTAAMAAMEETILQMESDSASCAAYEASEEFAQMLENQGISLAEYQMNADSRYTYLQGFIQELYFLEEFLEYADEGDIFMEDLENAWYLMAEEQKQICGYSYTGVNYWFAGWGEEEVAYVRQQVLDRLVSFAAEDFQWEDSREAVEARMNTYLDRVEEIDRAWAASAGESWERVNEEKERQEQSED